MIDHQTLKLDDPGGDIAAAKGALQAMTVPVSRGEEFINSRTVYAHLGPVDGEAFLQGLEAIAGGNPVVARILSWLQPAAEAGVDVCHAATREALTSLVGQAGITQAMVDTLLALAVEDRPKYPGLTTGDIEYARSL